MKLGSRSPGRGLCKNNEEFWGGHQWDQICVCLVFLLMTWNWEIKQHENNTPSMMSYNFRNSSAQRDITLSSHRLITSLNREYADLDSLDYIINIINCIHFLSYQIFIKFLLYSRNISLNTQWWLKSDLCLDEIYILCYK